MYLDVNFVLQHQESCVSEGSKNSLGNFKETIGNALKKTIFHFFQKHVLWCFKSVLESFKVFLSNFIFLSFQGIYWNFNRFIKIQGNFKENKKRQDFIEILREK